MKSLRIISDGTPQGTQVLDERGDPVKLALHAVTFRCVADELPSTVLELECMLVPLDVDGKVAVETLNPSSGNWERVSLIRFADGTEWAAP